MNAQENIVFDSEKKLLQIGESISVLEDVEGKLKIDDILKKENQEKFQQQHSQLFSTPISSSAYWIKFTINNHSNQDIWLALNNSTLLEIDFYTPDKNGNYSKVIYTGSLRPVESRPYFLINGFWLPLNKANEKQNKTYYVRITGYLAIDVVLEVATLPKLHQEKTIHDILSAAFIGILLIMILYNSFLFFSTKDKIYLWYTGHLAANIFTATFLNSFPIVEYLTGYQLQSFWHNYFSIWTYPALIFSGLFCIHYLNLKTNSTRAKKLIEWIIFLQIGIILLNLTGAVSFKILTILEELLSILLYSSCLFVAYYLLLAKNVKQTKYYVLGWTFFWLGLIVLVLSGNGVIPQNIYIRNASYFGVALEVWMFSLALGDRMKILQKEREDIEIEKERIKRQEEEKRNGLILQQKKELESRVRERTEKLFLTLQENKKINLKLDANNKIMMKAYAKNKLTNFELKETLNIVNQQKEEILSQNTQLEQLNSLKDRVFSIIAHDLKSPINNLQGLLILFEDDYGLTQDEIQQLIHRVSESVSGISELLNNLLYWARSQMQGSLTLVPKSLEVKTYIQEVIQLFIEMTRLKNIQTIIQLEKESLTVCVDPEILRFILRNLLNNAYKFSNENGQVTIKAVQEVKNSVKISIKDEGMGVDETTKNELFKGFVKSKDGTHSEKGTGLGLMLCQEFIELSDGSIGIESELGKGSTFWFTLPTSEKEFLKMD